MCKSPTAPKVAAPVAPVELPKPMAAASEDGGEASGVAALRTSGSKLRIRGAQEEQETSSTVNGTDLRIPAKSSTAARKRSMSMAGIVSGINAVQAAKEQGKL